MKKGPTLHLAGYLTVALTLLILFFGCKNDLPLQGFDPEDGFDPRRRGQFTTEVLGTLEEVTFSDTVTVTGRSPFLALGEYKGVEARILMKFAPMPDSLDVLSAAILLRTNAIFHDRTNKTSFTATCHEALSEWADSTVTYDSFGDAFDPTPIASIEMLSVDRGSDTLNVETVRIELDSLVLEQVLFDSTSNFNRNGIVIKANGATFIKEFFSVNNEANRPQLELRVAGEDSGEVNRIFVEVQQDAFVARELNRLPSDLLYVDYLFTRHVVLKFDLSHIPRETLINRASMKINLNKAYSIIKSDGVANLNNGFALMIERLKAPFQPGADVEIDSSRVQVLTVVPEQPNPVVVPDGQFASAFRRFIQDWVDGSAENHGMIMRTFTSGFDVSRLAIQTSTPTDSTAGPILEIEYSVAPNYP